MDLHRRYWAIMAFGLAAAGAQGCRLTKNFHVVEKGEFYRSAQLTREELNLAIDEAGIRTVINLRGEAPGKDWFDTEVAVAKERGVELVNIPMRSEAIPRRADLIKLLDAYKSVARPILIHCQFGADRTGEAAAIYQMEYLGKSRKEALKSLTPKYFHFEIYKPSKRYFMGKIYQGASWAYNEYDPCKQDYKHFDRDKQCNGNPPPDVETEEYMTPPDARASAHAAGDAR